MPSPEEAEGAAPAPQWTVAIVAKPCLPGRVKTRLAPDFSLEQAAELAEASLRRTVDTVRSLNGIRPVLFFDGDSLPDWAAGFELLRQPGGELDERLGYLFDSISGPLLLIGMDTPQVSTQLLSEVVGGFEHEAYLGLAPDGGFWALGMRKPRGDLIRGVEMSQEDTGAQQLRRLEEQHGSTLKMLPELEDFDDRQSALQVADLIAGSSFAKLVHKFAQA